MAKNQLPARHTTQSFRKNSGVSETTDGVSTNDSVYNYSSKSHLDSHVFTQLKAKIGPKSTLILGHRGGFFGPENSIPGFQGAIDHKLDGVEFDVWLSKDGVPMVLHGGQ